MKITYEEKFTAFIDVLGFSNLVHSERVEKHEKLEKYFELVEHAFKLIGEDKETIQKLAISDSIILIANDSEEELRKLLTAIRTLQTSLSKIDIWVRGGITFGKVDYNEEKKVIVGPGYIKAYLLEAQAIYPRVIIDPSIVNKYGITRTEFYKKYNGELPRIKLLHDYNSGPLRFTQDDAIFVCYANNLIENSVTTGDGTNTDTELDTIYNHIRKNLYGPQEHYHKYLWLKKYFLEAITESYSRLEAGTARHNQLKRLLINFSDL